MASQVKSCLANVVSVPPSITTGSSTSSSTRNLAAAQKELEELELRNKRGASAYEALKKQASEWKQDADKQRSRVDALEKELSLYKKQPSAPSKLPEVPSKQGNAQPDFFADISFPSTNISSSNSKSPASSFDPLSQSLI